MPARDRTGPSGMGPMTGHGAGYCAGSGVSGYMSQGVGGGFGGGRRKGGGHGFGRGCGYGRQQGAVPYNEGSTPYAAPTHYQELGALKEQLQYFEDTLKGIQERIAELEASVPPHADINT